METGCRKQEEQFSKNWIRLVGCFFLIVFASASQAQNLDPARWETAMAAFDAQDSANAPQEGGIVLTGSSSIARWNNQAAAALAPLTVIARGFGGSVMSDALYHLDRAALR